MTENVPAQPRVPDTAPRDPMEGHTSRYVPVSGAPVDRPAAGVGVVPAGVKAASEWSWRLLLIAAGLFGLGMLVRSVSEVIVPLAIATLLAALLRPIALRLRSWMPAGAAAGVTVLGTIILVSALLTLVGSQFQSGLSDLTSQVAAGLVQIRDWLRTTFKITDAQFNDVLRHDPRERQPVGQPR